ncbi:MAG: hypothetical protein R3C60_02910 [Parvularculaceae bacterium]
MAFRLSPVFLIAALFPAHAAAADLAGDKALGWVTTFSTGAAPADAPFEAPDYAGSEIEAMLRGELKKKLATAGRVEAAGDQSIRFTIKLDQPSPKVKLPPKSPLQFQSVPIDPTGRIKGDTVRPSIAIIPKKGAPRDAPTMKVTLYAYRGNVRIWSGFAGAPLEEGVSRHGLARALLDAALDHFGETAKIEDMVFSIDPPEFPE